MCHWIPDTCTLRVSCHLRDFETKLIFVGDWELFAAAVASASTRDMFIQLLAKWINQTPTSRPLTDLYDTVTGG